MIKRRNTFIIEDGVIKKKITDEQIRIPKGVTSIGPRTFAHCYDLANIIIPKSVISIEEKAFYACESLKSITLPEKLAFIGEKAFCACEGLQSITIPASVTYIGKNSFAGCDSLQTVYCEAAAQPADWENSWLGECSAEVVWGCEAEAMGYKTKRPVEENVTVGEVSAKRVVKKKLVPVLAAVLSLILAVSVTTWYLFFGPGRFVVENGILTDYRGFEETVIIPDNVTSIGENAFYNCEGVKFVAIPENVTYVGKNAFLDCPNLQVIYFETTQQIAGWDVAWKGNSAASVSWTPISDFVIKNDVIIGYKGSADYINLPKFINSIGENAFAGCNTLLTIVIPESVTSIGANAFAGCIKLQSISIPEGVTSLGANAFSGCSSLKKIMIPESITSIGANAFAECNNLETIYCEAPSRPSDWARTWYGYTDAQIVWGYTG